MTRGTGALGQTEKPGVCTSGQPALLTVMTPPTAPAGTVAVIVVSLTTLKEAATLFANFTPVTLPPFMKLIPVMVTLLPGLPAIGWRSLMAGHVSPGVMLKFASEISKKMFPTASTLMRAVEVSIPFGRVTLCDPSFGVLASRVVGKVNPPSVERVIATFAQLTGAKLV